MAEPRPNEEYYPLHTTTPRLLASFSPLLFMVLGIAAFVLQDRGLLAGPESDADGLYQVDPEVTAGLVLLLTAALLLPVFSWGWWYIAAMSNARARSMHAGSPWMLPVSVLVMIGAVTVSVLLGEQQRIASSLLLGVAVLAYFMAAYGVLFSVRKSALAVKGETRHWNRLLWLPWLSMLLSVVLYSVAIATESAPVAVLAMLTPSMLSIWGWANWCMGMASFDRACRGYQVARDMNTDMPAFMMGQKALR